MYSGPDGATLPLHLGINKWGTDCASAYFASYQTTGAGSGVVSGGGAYQNNARDCNLADADAHGSWTWFRLSRLADDTVHAEWSTEDSTAPPTSGWVLLSTFSISSSPDRIGLLHKTGTTDVSTCSFRDFSLISTQPSPPPSPPPPSPPPSPPPPLQLNGVLLTPDQPDAVDTAYSVDGNGVLVTSSSAVHDAWTGRDGALVLYATKPGEPWAAAVRMQMSANAEDQALLSRSKKQSQDQPAFRADLALRVASCWLSCLLARRGPQPHPMTPHPITTPSPPPLLSGLRAHHVLGP